MRPALKSIVLVTFLLLAACTAPATVAGPVPMSRFVPPLGVVLDSAQTVVDLDPGGVADNAGVHRGDILVALEGHPFATDPQGVRQVITDIVVALPDNAPLPAEALVTLILRRAGQEVDLPVNLFGSTRYNPSNPPATVTAMPPDTGLYYF